jgi:thiamine-monophosphate kinase
MGCKPIGFSLSISNLLSAKSWYEDFAIGVTEIADEYQIPLIGGDFVKGNLNINVVVYGVPYNNKILKRNGASNGDVICISTPVGSAKKGLEEFKSGVKSSENITNYLRPKPKFNIGKSISEIASSCIDTSDGLLVDLKHILDDSKVGAHIYLDNIPFTTDIEDINAGDDYDLCFTIPEDKYEDNFIKIGKVTNNKSIKLISEKGYDVSIKGFKHFQ